MLEKHFLHKAYSLSRNILTFVTMISSIFRKISFYFGHQKNNNLPHCCFTIGFNTIWFCCLPQYSKIDASNWTTQIGTSLLSMLPNNFCALEELLKLVKLWCKFKVDLVSFCISFHFICLNQNQITIQNWITWPNHCDNW
jgi:hypothetical protein